MKGYMTTKQAAEYLDYTTEYISYLCKKGKLSGAERAGVKVWLIPEQSVYEYKPGLQGFAAVKARKLAEKEEFRRLFNAARNSALCEVQP